MTRFLFGLGICALLVLAWVASVTVTDNLSDWLRTVLP